MFNTRSTLLLLSATLVLNAAAAAQGSSRTIELPSGGFVPAAVGEYTGQKWQHAVLIKDQLAWLCYSPMAHSSVTCISQSWSVKDVATLARSGSEQADDILGIGSAGLTLGQYDAAGDFSSSVLQAGSWVNGVEVECAGDTAAALVVGLSSDRTAVGVAGIANGTFGGDLWVNQGAVVLQVAVFDWDDDGTMEVAVLTAGSLKILDTTLVPLVTLTSGGGAIARLRNSAAADELAWVRPAGSGSHELVVLSGRGSSTPLALALPLATGSNNTFPLVGIASGDANGDGNDDLVIAQNATSEIVVLYRQAGTAPFVVPSTAQPDVGKVQGYGDQPSAAGALIAPPQFRDINNDTFDDFVFTSGPKVYVSALEGDEVPALPTSPDVIFGFQPAVTENAALKVRFQVPATVQVGDCIQLTVWGEWCRLEGDVPIARGIFELPFANTYLSLAPWSGPQPGPQPLEPLQQVLLPMQFELDSQIILLNEEIWCYEGLPFLEEFQVQPHLWIQARFIHLTGNQVDSAGPDVTFAATVDNTDSGLGDSLKASAPFLTRLMTPSQSGFLPYNGNPIKGIQGRTRLIGGVVPVTGLPKTFTQGARPSVGVLTSGGNATLPTPDTQ